ncbi:MBL fold metallo-hydrolase [Nocardia sp. NPDC052566]|uniref:MBL fold metallo-hydrolase n=1 Tax=Nocardia sp. NPDC052566 TaxID=3364330 RepID=UPI0037C64E55
MCECRATSSDTFDAGAIGSGPNRRSLLASGLAAMGMFGLAACGSSTSKPAGPTTPNPVPDSAIELITLGTEAGPPPGAARVGIASALSVRGKVYIVDCGRSAVTQFVEAGLKFTDIAGIFLTHLHADHLADYNNFFMLGGWFLNPDAPGFRPIPVYGPGPAGGLPGRDGGGEVWTLGDNPTPGTVEMTNRLLDAFAYSYNIFARDSYLPDPRRIMNLHDIVIPDVGASFTNVSPVMKPFPIMSDDRVRVTATLVEHDDVFPAFAYRFDLADGGSVTFSGDTVKSGNLITLAQGTDLLVHESIFEIDEHPTKPATYTPAMAGPPDYFLRSHTPAIQVGEVAKAADVKKLVVSHYGPGDLPDGQWIDRIAKGGYGGPISIARDNQVHTIR